MNAWPYTDFHNLNLDWLLQEMKNMREEWEEFQELYPPANAESPENITEPVEVEITPND